MTLTSAAASPRHAVWTLMKNLRCPRNHPVRYDYQPHESGFRRCEFSYGHTLGRCGSWMHIVMVRGGGAIVSDAEAADVRRLASPDMTPTAIIEALRPTAETAQVGNG